MSTRIRILIVDNHPVARLGLRAMIGGQPDMDLVAAVANLEQTLPLCRIERPNVILLDLNLPNTFPDQAVRQIRRADPSGRILLLSTDEAGANLCQALDAGAVGCVLRTAEGEEIIYAIRTLHVGKSWLSQETVKHWGNYRAGRHLSEEELACLRLLAAGKNTRQIGDAMGWSASLVRASIRRIQSKLDAYNPTHMLVKALRLGIVSVD